MMDDKWSLIWYFIGPRDCQKPLSSLRKKGDINLMFSPDKTVMTDVCLLII